MSNEDAMDAAVDTLKKHQEATPLPRPANSFTAAELSAHKHITNSTARRFINDMLEAGIVTAIPGRIRGSNGGAKPTTFYVRAPEPEVKPARKR